MLFDEWTAVYSHDLVAGKSLAELSGCCLIILLLIVRRVQYGVVHDEEVGVCGG